MSNIFTFSDDSDLSDKLNLDELYETKQQYDLSKLNIFNKILNRIHAKIKVTSRQKINEQFCWFLVPEVVIGVPRYDQSSCIAYIVDKLKKNGFNVTYTHPNLLLISWTHWIPAYVRQEFKKKTGIVIDGYGNKVGENTNKNVTTNSDSSDVNALVLNRPVTSLAVNKKDEKEYKPITSYKPTGNLIYNNELIKKVEDKFKN